ncbi:unnamed protein product [Caenorhabditis bovis]|uniref:Uncharacterized protein n=1 Tax=Caenorhabditis bovis TaxID=2654633 RepID=A0A8S1F8J0_9PELO|nr:unnamed protein product [Caenorhabditis bovis]
MIAQRVLQCTPMTIVRSTVCRFSMDPLERKMAQKRAEVVAQQNQEDSMKYATKTDFQQNVQDTRHAGAACAETGQVPTRWQRRFLVITKLYPNIESIPPYVHNGTMNRMHDRMRVVFIVVATGFFFSIFYAAELLLDKRIQQDRRAGVVVTKM